MKRFMLASCIFATLLSSQVNTSRIDGVVTDPTGAAVPGAEVTVTNSSTDQAFKTTTSDRGEWTVPTIPAATYKVSVTKTGFKAGLVPNVELNAGVPATVNVKLEVGQATETVEVVGGAEIVQATSATVSNTVSARQVYELPFATRNAVELLVSQPGVQTPTNPRSSSVNGLPRGALNVTIDGMNTQDNLLKSSDGFFSYIFPSVDALDEVTLSSSAGSADATSQGAAQIKFITKSGTNSFHGGAFYQVRNTALNANYYFNNQGSVINGQNVGQPRDVVKLTQRGVHIGGPIKKDKLFFFFNYEQYRLPGSSTYTRTVLTDDAQKGNFTYRDSSGAVRAVNLLTLASAAGFTGTVDPILSKTYAQISATAAGGALRSRVATSNDYNRNDLVYQPTGNQQRDFYTGHIDYNLTFKHHLSFVYNYDRYVSIPDFLNNVVAAFPGTGTVLGSSINTGQRSNRFAGTIALRSALSARLTNEFHGGLDGGTVLFFDAAGDDSLYSQWHGYRPTFGFGLSGVTTANSAQRRNSPTKSLGDTVSWVKGSHQLSFGGNFDAVNLYQQVVGTGVLPSITMGVASGDPINTGSTALFTVANFPGASSTNLSDAAAMYAALTGRVSSIGRQLVLDEKTKQYQNVPTIDRDHIKEYGLFAQDTWRVTPGLTLTAGLRFEKQLPFVNDNGLYTKVGLQSLWGLSGVGHLFQPGTLTGTLPTYTPIDGSAYKSPPVYAPSVGLAWQTPRMSGILGKIFGQEAGKSVFRAGYSISTVREGSNIFLNIWGSNTGLTQDATVSNAATPNDFGAAGSVLFRGNLPTRSGLQSSPSFPIPANFTSNLNDFDPNLKMGYVQSWNIGWQRAIGRDQVMEIRYVGNHGVHIWRQYNLNEVNTVESGFGSEFKVAQRNLAIARGCAPTDLICASTRASVSNNYGNQGLPGQGNVPILQTSIGNTTDQTTVNNLINGAAGTSAQNIANNSGRMANLTKAGFPANLFFVNPTVGGGGAFIVTNDGSSFYDAMQVEFRKRMSHGMLAQASYAWSKSLANGATNSSSSTAQPTTLRNLGIDKVASGFDLRHAIKGNYIYELPFGPRRHFLANVNNGFARKAIEGWEIAGTARIQSGLPFFFSAPATSGVNSFGSVNAQFPGIVLHNVTSQQLQDMVSIRKTTATNGQGIVNFLPQNVIDNTIAAFQQGTSTLAALKTDQPYIGPAAAGELGWRGYVRMPFQHYADVSLLKKTAIGEKASVEFRAQAINVLNITNFNAFSNLGSSFGQVTGAYRDISGGVEPGGRILEFMLRINF